ncbi:hypothetical protein MNBD_GAMMA01-410 [hydrothermal vent metagenome]|uniref:DUF2961 domain-containing protein n=1 Tax=hydrothermal vent metagenome TaxID=652676 RepID=A0A3B0VPG6_9ZZZZ
MLKLLLLLFCLQLHALPWETWQDSKSIAKLNKSTQSLLRSSYCPYNCRFDRTSQGDTRFLRIEKGEAVIFEELNPGAITRIWMTSGYGTSDTLDANVRIKFYFDGKILPTIDVSLPDLFNGNTPPFEIPLAGDRLYSSGGNFSYVPIPYSQSLKITLTNAKDYILWFQFNYQRMSAETKVNTFSMLDDFSALKNKLNQSGNIWQSSQILNQNTLSIPANVETILYNSNQAGWIKSIKLNIDEAYFDDIQLILKFDNETHSQLSLSNFFAIGKNNGIKTKSLFLGLTNTGELYSNFPMPYFQNVSISLLLTNASSNNIDVAYEIGVDTEMPPNNAGVFSTQTHNTCPSTPLIDLPLLDLNKQGKWVGLFSEFSSINTLSRSYLEGDERVYIDGDTHPTHYGTGTEDFYNGGFYFDQGDISLSLHGSPYHYDASSSQSITSAYRFMLTDGIEFQSSILAKMENGPYGDLQMCATSVAYFYVKPNELFQQIDTVDLNSDDSTKSHNYLTSENESCNQLNANFLDEPGTSLNTNSCQISAGNIAFTFDNSINATNLRIRRLFDNNISGQVADIYVNSIYQGTYSYVPEKPAAYIIPTVTPDRRWQQESIELGSEHKGLLQITIIPRFTTEYFTAAKYELLGQKPQDVIFNNSFDKI